MYIIIYTIIIVTVYSFIPDPTVTHGCIIATIKLYVNDVELPG